MADLSKTIANDKNNQTNLRRSTVDKSFTQNSVVINSGAVEAVDLPLVMETLDLTGTEIMIWGHPTYGEWGTQKWGSEANVGSYVVARIVNPSNSFRTLLTAQENTYFVDTTNTTATVTAASQSISFTANEEYWTEILSTEASNVVSATITGVGSSTTGTINYYLTSVDHANYETTWYKTDEASGTTASDWIGSNDATLQYSGNDSSDGIIGYWPMDSGSVADESNNANDGTLSTSTVIDDCEATTGWSNVTLNSTTFKYGSGALNLSLASTGWRVADKTISSTDLSNKIVTLHVYVKDSAVLANLAGSVNIEFNLGSDDANRYKYYTPVSELSVGWNVFRVDVENPDNTNGTPPATSNITWMRFAVNVLATGSDGDVIFDHIQTGAPVKTTNHLGTDDAALFFPGDTAGGYVDLGAGVLDLTDGTAFTIGMWMKSNGTQLVENNYLMSASGQWSMYFDYASNTWGWYIEKGDGNFRYGNTTSSNHMDGEWHRLIITGDASRNIKIYEDGVLVGSDTYASSTFNTATNSYLGSWTSSYGNANVSMNEVFFHKGLAWTVDEILDDYNAGQVHKWKDSVATDGPINNALRINGVTQYHMTTPVTIPRIGGSISWWGYITQHMLDNGFVMFSSGWKSGNNHIVFKYEGGSNFIYYETNTNGSGQAWTQPAGFTTGWNHFVMSWDQTTQPSTANLVAHYKLDDDAANTTVVDSSASGFDGTASANTNTLNTNGIIDGALAFDGSTTNVDLGTQINYSSSDSFTISAWIFANNDLANTGCIFGGRGGDRDCFVLNIGGTISMRLDDTQVNGTNTINWGQWNHVAIVYNYDSGTPANTTVDLYVNGVKETPSFTWYTDPALDDWTTGQRWIGYESRQSWYFKGNIDDVRVYNTNLSEAEMEIVRQSHKGICTLYVNATSQGTGSELGYGIISDLSGIDEIGNQGFDYNYGDIAWTEMADIRFSTTNPLTQNDVESIYRSGAGTIHEIGGWWEPATIGTPVIFTNPGTNLRLKAVAEDSASINIKKASGEMNSIRIDYTTG